ncbi:MAG: ketopantoate reductase family protein [Myxococcales bacterium]|nr:ketopantoate reductase family protein [Myxococcales bacterium]
MLPDSMKIVFFGTGVIGGSVGGWIAPHYPHLYFLDREPISTALRTGGITLYQQETPAERQRVSVRVIDDLAAVPDADVVVLGVKNYSLEGAARAIREKLGDRPVIFAMQNGAENQRILPHYFSKVIYCVVSYNAWMDEPVVIGYQKKGPLVIGTIHNELQPEMAAIARVFNLGVETIVTPHLQDAVYTKMVINLTNSLTTLIGMGYREIGDRALFQKLLTNMTYEGIQILRAAGFNECKLGGMPSWLVIRAGAKLPRLLTKPLFERNVKKMVLSSMAQDVLQRRGGTSELETLNGHLLHLADRHGLAVPYNRAVYELCREEFSRPDFQPLEVKEVWLAVKKQLAARR